MDQATRKKYNYWQWRTLIILMIGYALFYFVRKNFSIAMPALNSELGLTKTQLGLFLTLNGVIYGLSRLVNGFLADRFSRKKMMALGLLLSAIVNIAIGFIPAVNSFFNVLDASGKATLGFVYILGSLWLINGYVQGMGYPPCSSLMAHWVKPSELATKQSIWNASHSIGAGLLALMIGAILGKFTNAAWQWCFWAPAILAIGGAAMIFFGLKDTPASVGLPSPEEMDGHKATVATGQEEDPEITKLAYSKFVKKLAVGNPIIWIIAAADFFVYVIRFTILDWGSTILVDFKNIDITLAASIIGACEIVGGILGMLFAGWATDKFFKSRAQRTSAICTILAVVCLAGFWLVKDIPWLFISLLVLSAFFIYGPQALLGIAASNQATKRAAATANGLVGIVAYLSPIVSGAVFGLLADSKWGWDGVFVAAIAMGIVGTVLLLLLWNKPADGYAKADELRKEVYAEYEQKKALNAFGK
ncbi:MAG: MFS transporter [Bacteroidales bacterium]|nr:MFS transporter [Bacteroidales bacterium]